MIKNISFLIILYSFLAFIAAWPFYGLDFALSLASGGLTMLFNLAGLALLWHLIFSKKSIALILSVIIFKYLILVMILWILTTLPWMKPIGFVLGLGTLLLALLSATAIKSFSKIKN